MDSIKERIAGLPEWPEPLFTPQPKRSGMMDLAQYWELVAEVSIARLALAREWIVSPRHFPDCENRSIAAIFCHECEGKVLDALEVPRG